MNRITEHKYLVSLLEIGILMFTSPSTDRLLPESLSVSETKGTEISRVSSIESCSLESSILTGKSMGMSKTSRSEALNTAELLSEI